jgi:Bacteriophage minor capsid protein
MLKYEDVRGFISTLLSELGYGTETNPMPVFTPGPGTLGTVLDISPGRLVILTMGAGAGLDMEEVFDRPSVQVRSVGLQMDYNDAETLAQNIDQGLIGALVNGSQVVNGKYTLRIVRAGGGPALLEKDTGDRYHFVCNYIWEVTYQ